MMLDEYADLPEGEGVWNEERLENLSPGTWSPHLFSQKSTELQENAKLEIQVVSDTSQLPGLGSGTEFHYDHCSYDDCSDRQQAGEKFLVSLALKKGQVIGYALLRLVSRPGESNPCLLWKLPSPRA